MKLSDYVAAFVQYRGMQDYERYVPADVRIVQNAPAKYTAVRPRNSFDVPIAEDKYESPYRYRLPTTFISACRVADSAGKTWVVHRLDERIYYLLPDDVDAIGQP